MAASIHGPALPGQLAEAAATYQLFTQPAGQATMDDICGKAG